MKFTRTRARERAAEKTKNPRERCARINELRENKERLSLIPFLSIRYI